MRILLQCTIPYVDDDWHVGRFALLAGELQKIANVVARNLEPSSTGDDPVLSRISRGEFDEVPDRQRPDDLGTPTVSWPSYHSGRNGDFQLIEAVEPDHPLLATRGGERLTLIAGRAIPSRASTTSPTTTGTPRAARRAS